MSLLAHQQTALLHMVFSRAHAPATKNAANYIDTSWSRGLKVYLAHGHALAPQALRSAYPVLTELMGQESMDMLAKDFWHAHPPDRGDVAQWGAALADFVQDNPQLASEPYLADVIRLEWALHVASTAADPEPKPDSFALLTQQDPAIYRLALAQPCITVTSPWPVVNIVEAHKQISDIHTRSALNFDEKPAGHKAQTALVWRMGMQAVFRAALPGEAVFIQSLQSACSLEAALHSAPELNFETWLPLAVQTQLLLGAELL